VDPFVAEIRITPYNFAPRGWATCDGQLLPISQNTALFSLLGTTYGGNGHTTFALPNLQGSTPVGQGDSSTGTRYFLGQEGGVGAVTLLQSEMPAHTHRVSVSTQDAVASQPGGQQLAVAKGVGMYGPNTDPAANLDPSAIPAGGGSLPHNNMMPYLALTFIIALQGVFPPRP
jgi:microcystin-dependent protein